MKDEHLLFRNLLKFWGPKGQKQVGAAINWERGINMTILCTKCLCQLRPMYISQSLIADIADISASCKRVVLFDQFILAPISGFINGELLTNERADWWHLLFYFTYYVLKMFRTLIYPSSGACCACGVRFAACKTNTTKYQPQQKLQHTTNWEQDDRCGNSWTQSQAPEDGYINVRNMLST